MNDEQWETVGQVADSIDNLIAALKIPMPPALHLDGIRGTLPELSTKLKTAVREATGEDPWEFHDETT